MPRLRWMGRRGDDGVLVSTPAMTVTSITANQLKMVSQGPPPRKLASSLHAAATSAPSATPSPLNYPRACGSGSSASIGRRTRTRVGQYAEKRAILCIIRIILYCVLIRAVLFAQIIRTCRLQPCRLRTSSPHLLGWLSSTTFASSHTRMKKPAYVEPAIGWNTEDNNAGVIKYGVANYSSVQRCLYHSGYSGYIWPPLAF